MQSTSCYDNDSYLFWFALKFIFQATSSHCKNTKNIFDNTAGTRQAIIKNGFVQFQIFGFFQMIVRCMVSLFLNLMETHHLPPKITNHKVSIVENFLPNRWFCKCVHITISSWCHQKHTVYSLNY